MTPEQETAARLINELDEFATDLRRKAPKAAREVDQAMYSVMRAREAVGELMQVAAHQVSNGRQGPVEFQVL